MTTPPSIEIRNLCGKWVIDRRLSTDPEQGLKLQGINWMFRKAIELAAVSLHISLHSVSSAENPAEKKLYFKVLQIPTGGLSQITETRIIDWNEPMILNNFLFGPRRSRTRFIGSLKTPSNGMVPNLIPKTAISNPEVRQFLRGEIEDDGRPSSGFIVEDDADANLWIHSFDERKDGSWTAEHIWGFEMIGGERYHTCRLVVANRSGAYEMGRVVLAYSHPE